jgi:hypothetical protein
MPPTLKTIHTHHLPQNFPFPLAKLHSHTIPNKSWQFPLISPQNEQNSLTNLQLSWKGCTNGPPPYDGMQPILKWTTCRTSNSTPTSGSEVSHKHCHRHKLPQKYLPHASRTNQNEIKLCNNSEITYWLNYWRKISKTIMLHWCKL